MLLDREWICIRCENRQNALNHDTKVGVSVVTHQSKVNPRKAGNPSYDVSRDTCLSPQVNQTSHTHHHQSE